MMIPDRAPEKVTIEDLLRLKRAERPSPEFWTRFEQDLRAKQLAAIVEKRPWWIALRLPQAARVVARFQVPVGAAAILALSFVVVNQYHFQPVAAPLEQALPEAAASTSQGVIAAASSAPAPKMTESTVAIASVASPVEKPVVAVLSPKMIETNIVARSEVAADSSAQMRQPSQLTSMIPWGVGQANDTAASSQAPVSASLLETGLQVAANSDLVVTSLLGNAAANDNQTQTASAQVIEAKAVVAQAASPRELRRAKLLAGLVLADNATGSDVAHAINGRDLASNGISDDQLYDSARRMGMRGDRFTLKF